MKRVFCNLVSASEALLNNQLIAVCLYFVVATDGPKRDRLWGVVWWPGGRWKRI